MTAGRWDTGLDDFTFSIRASLHTKVLWVTPGPWRTADGVMPRVSGYGELDGPAALGPFAGWRLLARVLPTSVIDPADVWWRLAVTVANHDHAHDYWHTPWGRPADWSFMFGVGPVTEPPAFRSAEAAKQAFEDVCRGLRPDAYRVNIADKNRWWPLRRAPALIDAARRSREQQALNERTIRHEQGRLPCPPPPCGSAAPTAAAGRHGPNGPRPATPRRPRLV